MRRKFGPLLAGVAGLLSLWLVLPSTGAEPKPEPGADQGATASAAQNFAIEHGSAGKPDSDRP